jgi:signal transduction histidine kinase
MMDALQQAEIQVSIEDLIANTSLAEDERLHRFFHWLIYQVEQTLDIDPSLSEKEILRIMARNVIICLGAEFASLWIYNPERDQVISFGYYPRLLEGQEGIIPFENRIAAEVIRSRKSYFVPNIAKEEKFKSKGMVERLGIHSMLAIPFTLPRFSGRDLDFEGVIQIYYKAPYKVLTPLEIDIAELISKRVSHVIARRRINDLQMLNAIKDKIVEHIFLKLARREGIKMKNLFMNVIPELADMMEIQRCSLFSVTADREQVVLEAGYPEAEHGIGKEFSTKEPYIELIVNETGPFGEFENEKIFPTYILIHRPMESRLIPGHLKQFLEFQQINSVLYVPLRVDETVNYFLAFDAQAYHREFTDEQIEIFTFFGKELMKGLRLERMDDVLHDFKNPAIAIAGFARRVQKILADGEYAIEKERVDHSLEIILKEARRVQELALALHGEGRESIVDMTEILRRRFLINEEALKELKRSNVLLKIDGLDSPLWIRCFPLHIERVFDNLLNNASNALPEEGGEISIRTYQKGFWAVAEISNTGYMNEEEKDRCLLGEGRGKGLYICTRLIKQMGGILWVESQEDKTTFGIMLPLTPL